MQEVPRVRIKLDGIRTLKHVQSFQEEGSCIGRALVRGLIRSGNDTCS